MRVLVGVSRIFVGVLFIISGLIKLNDPVGFSFKLKDYFAPDVLNLEFLVPYALGLAVVIVIFEVMLGVMIILGYAKKFTLWSLLLMIVFFTFLTFYSAYFNKVTDCGCFGDALKLTPWESFWKDIVLLVLILILFFGRKYIQPFFSKGARSILVFVSLIGCLFLGYHVLQHLPVVDFRAYAIGKNISEGMQVPEGAPKPIFEYAWKFNINGSEEVIKTSGDYPQVDGEFISVETTELQAGYEPPVHDFSIERDDTDFTEKFLNSENLIVVIAYSLSNAEMDGFFPVRDITNEAIKKGYTVIGMSASSRELTEDLTEKYGLNFDFYFCDETTLKTIVRSNPGIIELQKGTITQKVHFNDVDKLILKELPSAIPNLDFQLKRKLDSIGKLDQQYRTLMQIESLEERAAKGAEMGLGHSDYSDKSLWDMQHVIDESNQAYVETILKERGYPGKSIVGEPTNEAAWYVIQHSMEQIPVYFPMIKKAGEAGEIPFRMVAMMEDRYLMDQNKPQIYGTQGAYRESMGEFIWPIQDPENVNTLRAKTGYKNTIEEYAKILFGEDFEYKVLTMDDIKE